MRKYELAVLLHPDLEIDLEAPLKKLEDILKDAKAKIVKKDDWGKRKLAYPINKQDFALYFFYQIEMPAENVGKIENALRISDEVIRHLIVNYEEPEQEEAEKKPKEQDKEEVHPPKLSQEKE